MDVVVSSSTLLVASRSPMPTEILETPAESVSISPEIKTQVTTVLGDVRRKLRQRIWLETGLRVLAFAIFWFLATWAVDYLPIWLGASELPSHVRAGLLGIGLFFGVAVIAWWGLRRQNIAVSDENVALLIERRYAHLADRLATLVPLMKESALELNQRSLWYTTMVNAASEGMAEDLRQVQPSLLFDWKQVRRWTWGVAGLEILTIGLLVMWPQWFWMAVQREVLLDARRWPRQADIQLAGIQPVLDPRLAQLLGRSPVLSPVENEYRVGSGGDVQLIVTARRNVAEAVAAGEQDQFELPGVAPVVPDQCTIFYQLADGLSGRQYMTRFGAYDQQREGFRFDGPPFQQIAQRLELSIFGSDDRVGPLTIQPVDNLSLVRLQLDCRFPEYLQSSSGTRWLPQQLTWTEGLGLPQGTDLQARLEFNKPVVRLLLLERGAQEIQIDWQGEASRQVAVKLGQLFEDQNWELWAEDSDHVWTRQAMEFAIEAQLDRPPSVQVDLVGIENAVTPDAVLPIQCLASDDHGLRELKAQLKLPLTLLSDPTLPGESAAEGSETEQKAVPTLEELGTLTQPLTRLPAVDSTTGDDQHTTQIDLRSWQQANQTQVALAVDQQQVIQLNVIATDYFQAQQVGIGDVSDEEQTHQTISHTISLEVVSPAALLRLLKRSEVGQRQRLEQIYQELLDERFYLQRCQSLVESAAVVPSGNEVTESGTASEIPEVETQDNAGGESAAADWDMAAVFARRAATQNEKSRQELLGVEAAFERIIQQIVNNRLEAAEYRRRLEFQIVQTMKQLTGTAMEATGKTLQQLDSQFEEARSEGDAVLHGRPQSSQRTVATIQLAMAENERSIEMLDQVLRDLLKFESDAELLELVRQLYEQQKRLLDETGRQQQQNAFEDLFGN